MVESLGIVASEGTIDVLAKSAKLKWPNKPVTRVPKCNRMYLSGIIQESMIERGVLLHWGRRHAIVNVHGRWSETSNRLYLTSTLLPNEKWNYPAVPRTPYQPPNRGSILRHSTVLSECKALCDETPWLEAFRRGASQKRIQAILLMMIESLSYPFLCYLTVSILVLFWRTHSPLPKLQWTIAQQQCSHRGIASDVYFENSGQNPRFGRGASTLDRTWWCPWCFLWSRTTILGFLGCFIWELPGAHDEVNGWALLVWASSEAHSTENC